MGKKQQFEIAGETFATKQAVVERCREIIAAYADNETVSDPTHDAFVRALIDRHPDAPAKIREGVAHVAVWTVPPYYANRGFKIVRADGSGVDFSFLKCLGSARSSWSRYCAAARGAVVEQTLGFKIRAFDAAAQRNEPVLCALTSVPLTRATAHTDHAAPATFDRIVRRFVADHDWTEAAVGDGPDGTTRVFVDPAYAARFAEYHRTHAVLRLLSATANMSLGARDVVVP